MLGTASNMSPYFTAKRKFFNPCHRIVATKKRKNASPINPYSTANSIKVLCITWSSTSGEYFPTAYKEAVSSPPNPNNGSSFNEVTPASQYESLSPPPSSSV